MVQKLRHISDSCVDGYLQECSQVGGTVSSVKVLLGRLEGIGLVVVSSPDKHSNACSGVVFAHT